MLRFVFTRLLPYLAGSWIGGTVVTTYVRLLPKAPNVHPSEIAAIAADSATDVGQFLQYGVLGLVVVGFITGWIVPGYQAKNMAAENARLLGLFENKLFPLIESSAEALGRASVAMEKSADALNKRTVDEAIEHARDRAGGT